MVHTVTATVFATLRGTTKQMFYHSFADWGMTVYCTGALVVFVLTVRIETHENIATFRLNYLLFALIPWILMCQTSICPPWQHITET